MTLRQNRQ